MKLYLILPSENTYPYKIGETITASPAVNMLFNKFYRTLDKAFSAIESLEEHGQFRILIGTTNDAKAFYFEEFFDDIESSIIFKIDQIVKYTF